MSILTENDEVFPYEPEFNQIGCDFSVRDGSCGESIYGGKFPDESSKMKHDAPGLLTMAIADRDSRGSLFNVTFGANRHLDRNYVIFGKLVQGGDVLKKIENVGDENGRPMVTVKIIYCGEISEGENVSSEVHSHEVKKSKKSSKGKKRKRYSSSDSDSSSDMRSESSDSDSDSDSDISLSDDRRKRKKRSSRKDRHRRSKRRDKRSEKKREKKRRKRDRKSKSQSKRTSSAAMVMIPPKKPSLSPHLMTENQLTGVLGEFHAYKILYDYCVRKKKRFTAEWLNFDGEKNLPYDIVLHSPNASPHFIQVKSTTCRVEDDRGFFFSEKEYKMAVSMGDEYTIMRVWLSVSREEALSYRLFNDPARLINLKINLKMGEGNEILFT